MSNARHSAGVRQQPRGLRSAQVPLSLPHFLPSSLFSHLRPLWILILPTVSSVLPPATVPHRHWLPRILPSPPPPQPRPLEFPFPSLLLPPPTTAGPSLQLGTAPGLGCQHHVSSVLVVRSAHPGLGVRGVPEMTAPAPYRQWPVLHGEDLEGAGSLSSSASLHAAMSTGRFGGPLHHLPWTALVLLCQLDHCPSLPAAAPLGSATSFCATSIPPR